MTRSIKFLFAVLAAALFVTTTVQAQDKAPKPADPALAAQPGDKPDQPKADPKTEKKDEKPAAEAKDVSEYEYAKMSTSKGDIFVRLDKTKAPVSTKNFFDYVDKKF